MFQTLKILPSHILGLEGEMLGVFGFGAGALLLLLVPFLDRAGEAPGRWDRLLLACGWAVIAFMAVMTILVYLPAES